MKKTITANIGGIVFHIDEDAYEYLNTYLQSIRSHFKHDKGCEEIMQDIESRIAEKLQEARTLGKEVISFEHVRKIKSELGEPRQIYGEAGPEEENTDGAKTQSSFDAEQDEKTHKRLYRDPNDKYIAGVAGGLAAYFNIDAIWVRLFFIVFIFVYGFSPFLYLILWIVVPKAKTTAEKLEMRGEKVNIHNIEKTIKEEFNEIRESLRDFTENKKSKKESQPDPSDPQESKKKRKPNKLQTFLKNVEQNMADFFKTFGKALAILAGLIALVVSFILIAIFITAWFSFPLFTHLGVSTISIPAILHLLIASEIIFKIIASALFFLIGIPLIMMMLGAILLLFGIKSTPRFVGITALVLWLGGLLALIFGITQTASHYTTQTQYNERHYLSTPESDTIYISTSDIRIPESSFSGHKKNHLGDIILQAGNEYIYGKPSLEIIRSNTFSLNKERVARGQGRQLAEKNAKNIRYNFRQTDSLLVLDPMFRIQTEKGWRNQGLHLKLEIPRDKELQIDDKVRNAFRLTYD